MTQLDRIRVARGGKRPETSDEWEQYERDKVARRAKNVVNAREVLERNQIRYRDWGRVNLLVHFSVYDLSGSEFWFYPETGLWFCIDNLQPEHRFGVRNLARHIKGDIE